jgi:hypothetical protein
MAPDLGCPGMPRVLCLEGPVRIRGELHVGVLERTRRDHEAIRPNHRRAARESRLQIVHWPWQGRRSGRLLPAHRAVPALLANRPEFAPVAAPGSSQPPVASAEPGPASPTSRTCEPWSRHCRPC